ncbi:MAG: UDP-N-acetylglucosamine 2-epimerase [Gammaproteobacteria bacterium]
MLHIFIGTKAQLIKMAPVMRELQQRGIEYNYISSGQHKETIDELIDCFELKEPDYVLYRGRDITGVLQMLLWSLRIVYHCLRNKQQIFRGDKNGVILNHGDTFSTLLGSVVGRLSGLKTAHVESGLRSFNLLHPFPEEITRLLVFRLSDYYFAPGSWAAENLKGCNGEVIDTGTNTLSDALKVAKENFARCSISIPEVPYGVVSLHRFENIFKQERLQHIVDELMRISEKHYLIFILHLPTKNKLEKFGLLDKLTHNGQIELRPRYDYLNFIRLVDASEFVISDGGSNQEECSYLGKPCLLFRNATERQEGIGRNVILSKFERKIIDQFLKTYAELKTGSVLNEQRPSAQIVDYLSAYYN